MDQTIIGGRFSLVCSCGKQNTCQYIKVRHAYYPICSCGQMIPETCIGFIAVMLLLVVVLFFFR